MVRHLLIPPGLDETSEPLVLRNPGIPEQLIGPVERLLLKLHVVPQANIKLHPVIASGHLPLEYLNRRGAHLQMLDRVKLQGVEKPLDLLIDDQLPCIRVEPDQLPLCLNLTLKDLNCLVSLHIGRQSVNQLRIHSAIYLSDGHVIPNDFSQLSQVE